MTFAVLALLAADSPAAVVSLLLELPHAAIDSVQAATSNALNTFLIFILISIPPPSGGTNSNESISQLFSLAYNSTKKLYYKAREEEL